MKRPGLAHGSSPRSPRPRATCMPGTERFRMELQHVKTVADGIRAEVAKAIVGQGDALELMLTSLSRGRPCSARGRARFGQDAHRPGLRRDLVAAIRTHPVHAGYDAGAMSSAPISSTSRPTASPSRPDRSSRRSARGRGQPHPAEDAGGSAAGHEPASRDHRYAHLRSRSGLHGGGDAKSDRAARHVSIAGGSSSTASCSRSISATRAATRSARSSLVMGNAQPCRASRNSRSRRSSARTAWLSCAS